MNEKDLSAEERGRERLRAVFARIEQEKDEQAWRYAEECLHNESAEEFDEEHAKLNEMLVAHRESMNDKWALELDISVTTVFAGMLREGVISFSRRVFEVVSNALLPSDELAPVQMAGEFSRAKIPNDLAGSAEWSAMSSRTNWFLADADEMPEGKGTKFMFAQINKADPTPPRVRMVVDGEDLSLPEPRVLGDGIALLVIEQRIDVSEGFEGTLADDGSWVFKAKLKP